MDKSVACFMRLRRELEAMVMSKPDNNNGTVKDFCTKLEKYIDMLIETQGGVDDVTYLLLSSLECLKMSLRKDIDVLEKRKLLDRAMDKWYDVLP
jgi:hypothetical protein